MKQISKTIMTLIWFLIDLFAWVYDKAAAFVFHIISFLAGLYDLVAALLIFLKEYIIWMTDFHSFSTQVYKPYKDEERQQSSSEAA